MAESKTLPDQDNNNSYTDPVNVTDTDPIPVKQPVLQDMIPYQIDNRVYELVHQYGDFGQTICYYKKKDTKIMMTTFTKFDPSYACYSTMRIDDEVFRIVGEIPNKLVQIEGKWYSYVEDNPTTVNAV